MFIVGRSSALKACVECLNVSREHLKIEIIRGDEIWITDLSSTNGTYYNGKRIEPNVSTRYLGETLCIGPLEEGVNITLKMKEEAGARPRPAAAASSQQPAQSARQHTVTASVQLDRSQVQRPAQQVQQRPQGGAEYDPSLIDLVSKKKEAGDINVQLAALKAELKQLEGERAKMDEFFRRVSEREAEERAIMKRVEELRSTELSFRNRIQAFESDADKMRQHVTQLQAEIEEWRHRKSEIESAYRIDEQKIFELREALKSQEAELHKRSLEVQSEQEKLITETEYLRKKCKLEADTLEAESRLRRTQIEREAEELRTKKVSLDREVETLTEKMNRLENSVGNLSTEKNRLDEDVKRSQALLAEIRAATSDVDARKRHLELEASSIADRIHEANESSKRILQSAETKAKETIDVANIESARLIEEAKKRLEGERATAMDEISRFRLTTENELRERERKLQSDIAQDKKEAEEAILKSKNDWKVEHEYLKNKATKDYESATQAWKAELSKTREKDAEELRLWKAEEEKRMRSLLGADLDSFAHQIASKTLAEFPPDQQTVQLSDLMNTLELKFKAAMTEHASEHGAYNPNIKAKTRKFWTKAAIGTAAAAALVMAMIHGPQFIEENYARIKVLKAQEDQEFLKQAREQHARMLALQLEPRRDFQDNYVDNILYNPGYLAMKMDQKLQKEWTVKLSQFFFEELLFDDRKVVEFIPLETALIRKLSETYKVMNKRSFDVNVAQMREDEQKGAMDMWLAIGGKENWDRVRKLEHDFYQKHAAGIELDEPNRAPASGSFNKF